MQRGEEDHLTIENDQEELDGHKGTILEIEELYKYI